MNLIVWCIRIKKNGETSVYIAEGGSGQRH